MNSRIGGVLYTFVISALFVTALATLNVVTRSRIIENEEIRLQSSILHAVGLIDPEMPPKRSEIAQLFSENINVIEHPERDIYVADDTDKRMIAFLVSSPGVWGTITAAVALEEGFARIAGIDFFEHSETPGLGGRIDETQFKDQFRGLVVSDEPAARISVIRIEEASKEKSQIRAITGATGTSESIQGLINKAINDVLPEVVRILGEEDG